MNSLLTECTATSTDAWKMLFATEFYYEQSRTAHLDAGGKASVFPTLDLLNTQFVGAAVVVMGIVTPLISFVAAVRDDKATLKVTLTQECVWMVLGLSLCATLGHGDDGIKGIGPLMGLCIFHAATYGWILADLIAGDAKRHAKSS